jgi:hypothetical protein
VIIEGGNDFFVVIIVNVADSQVEAIGTKPALSVAVSIRSAREISTDALTGVIPGPAISQGTVRLEDEDVGVFTLITGWLVTACGRDNNFNSPITI